MKIEKISLKLLTVSMLLMLGIMAVATSFVSENEYLKAAITLQTAAIARTLNLESESTLASLRSESKKLATAEVKTLVAQADFFSYLAEAPAGTHNPVFANLFNAAASTTHYFLKPVAVRLYNSKQEMLMQSHVQSADLADTPSSLIKGTTSGRTHSGLWRSSDGPRYSFFQPIRKGQTKGLLEIVSDPIHALQRVATKTGMPIRIASPDGTLFLETGTWEDLPDTVHRVSYTVTTDNGEELLEITVLDDFTGLYETTEQTRNTTTLVLIALMGTALFVAVLILNRFLFKPVGLMIQDMHRVAQGETAASVKSRSLKEFSALADAFNSMTQQVQDTIERERQIAEDVKGKVELIQDVVTMAAQGDLTGQVMVYRDKDIISELADGIQQMLDSLNSLVARIQQSGVQVTSSATEIAATAKQQEATVTEQAATTNQIKATVTEITSTSKELVNTMNDVTEVAWKTSESANAGRSSLHSMEKTMHQMMEATESIGSKLAVLSEKAGNINTVVTTISRVADQTNLLSLNAAIEAEKAGEYGVGFAVVATEIRRLADQTAVATWDIEQMVKEMQSAVSAGVMGMEKFSEEVRRGVDDVRQVGSQLAHIIEQVDALIPRFEEVNEGMSSQAQGGQQIRDAIIQLSEAAQQTADSLRQSNGAILQLNDAASRLQEGSSHFKVSSQESVGFGQS
jgi:methyl-accepting chemotaxis protein WspA